MTAEYVCPTCGNTLRVEHRDQAPYRPFCSRRCQLLDLHKWFNEEYRISSPAPELEDGDDPGPERN